MPKTHAKRIFSRTGVLLVLLLGMAYAHAQTAANDTLVVVGKIQWNKGLKTRNYVIRREILFNAGDTMGYRIFKQKLEQSRLNLVNTSLFNFVTIDTLFARAAGNPAIANISLNLLERWYVWPIPFFQLSDRDFNTWWQTRDFTRVNFGMLLEWKNFSGRYDPLTALVQIGKNHAFQLSYNNPYIDKKKKIGFGIGFSYLNTRELVYQTQNDKVVSHFYPNGLLTEYVGGLSVSYRNNYYINQTLMLQYHSLAIADTILTLNPAYSLPGLSKPAYLSLYYKLKFDRRDIKYYPLKGWYTDLELTKNGLGFKFENGISGFQMRSTSRLFVPLSKRWFSGVSLIGQVTLGKEQPYFLLNGFGPENIFVRGYQTYTVNGLNWALGRSSIKWLMLPQKTVTIPFLPEKIGKIHYSLYLTSFADVGYVEKMPWAEKYNNRLPGTLLVGTGLGLDLVTYYDRIFRIEYAINKSGKSGIFIHLVSGI